MIAKLALALAATLLPTGQTPQTAPDPHRPTPTFDSVPPELPALRKPAVLIFSKTSSFRHDSIPDAVAAIAKLAKAHGWSSYATENAAIFNDRQLAQFDLIVFASASGDMFTPDQRAAFQTYLRSGRGFAGFHAAGDGSHPGWYQAILGYGGYAGHPGGADQFQSGNLIVADPNHPATRRLTSPWRWTEEYYAWSQPVSADSHVLLRLDETDMRFEPKQRMGANHAMAWWRCEGRARIFYSALGHKPETWSDPQLLALVDGGLTWAIRKAGTGCDAQRAK